MLPVLAHTLELLNILGQWVFTLVPQLWQSLKISWIVRDFEHKISCQLYSGTPCTEMIYCRYQVTPLIPETIEFFWWKSCYNYVICSLNNSISVQHVHLVHNSLQDQKCHLIEIRVIELVSVSYLNSIKKKILLSE